MKQFFKFLFASCLGTLIALVGLTFFGIWSVNSLAKKMEKTETVNPNTVLRIDLAAYIPERTNNIPVNPYDVSFDNESVVGLQDLIEALEVAKTDDNIKGVFLDMSVPNAGLAKLEALRRALYDFKESGKWIVSYGQYYTKTSYYLAAVSDKVYLNPMGGLDFGGFSTQLAFMKEFLDKTGIKMEVFYAGKFKSATEPFRRNEMSEENRLQIREYLNGVYNGFLENISEDRDISVAELRRIADEMLIQQPQDAVDLGLVDQLMYKDEVLNDLRDRIGLDDDKGIPTIGLSAYHMANGKKTNFRAKDKIAVVYAEGTIVDGEGEAGSIGGDRYAKMIRKIRKDRKVKAIVLRVNSGGGSGMASENILHEIKAAKAQGITVVTSMGEAAASGGYYIACESEAIFAEENTVTGSIGVFGVLPNVKRMMEEKVGVHFDSVKTTKYATMGSPFFDLSEEERRIIQTSVDSFYQKFLQRVADGRDMSIEEVDAIAQGRIWTGTKAKEIDLVDQIGGLDAAIAKAAELTGLESYRLSEYPKTKEPLQQLIEDLTGTKTVQATIRNEIGEDLYPYYKMLKEVQHTKGVQMRMPFILEVQ